MKENDLTEDEGCMAVGRCEAAAGERGITNCVWCGKELHEKDGHWWTWDADQYSNPKSQGHI